MLVQFFSEFGGRFIFSRRKLRTLSMVLGRKSYVDDFAAPALVASSRQYLEE